MFLLSIFMVNIFAVLFVAMTYAPMLGRPVQGSELIRVSARTTLRWVLPAFLISYPLFKSMRDAQQLASGEGLAIYDSTAAMWMCLAGALGWTISCAVELLRRRHNIGFWTSGLLLVCLVQGAVAISSVTSHLRFVSDRDFHVISLAFLEDKVKDVQCESPVIEAHWDGSDIRPLEYRCPTGLIFFANTPQPFIPWPSFTEGESVDLAIALKQMLDSARRLEPGISTRD